MKVRFSNAYTSRLSRAAAVNGTVADAFGQVVNLYDRPERLLRPSIVGRVLATNLARRKPPAAQVPARPVDSRPASGVPQTGGGDKRAAAHLGPQPQLNSQE